MSRLSIDEVKIFVDGKAEGYSLALKHYKYYFLTTILIGVIVGSMVGLFIGTKHGVTLYRDWRGCISTTEKSYDVYMNHIRYSVYMNH